ncbi:WGR domain-containing protein [Oscillatoria sp. FACHB-1406]|uniref:WGR domain-containing protein n=1 Tax=Oscillatoria sp. FACHB-1406 TaxID=2692846 RepID=UPI0016823709|nr:WGR domain-containing protein [Oscillatoria sp. FACHB-1406]MBD2578220.1 WGR domain-containing protein [Oscillatoria sp. FACHB-1406]
MELIRRMTLSFQEGTSDKVYEVDLCQVGGGYLVNFRYGRRGATLKEGTKTTQPVTLARAEQLFEKLVTEKTRKGYREAVESQEVPSTVEREEGNEEARKEAILRRLMARDGDNWPLERVIWRAGELKLREAVPALISLLRSNNALRDYCIVAALGWCGDESAIADVQHLYETPTTPEFVKRIAWEALYKLETAAERLRMKEEKISELPQELQELARNGSADNFSIAANNYLQQEIYIEPAVKEFQAWVKREFSWEWLNDRNLKKEVNAKIEALPEPWRSRFPKLIVERYVYWNPYYVDNEVDAYVRAEKSNLFTIIDTFYQIDNEYTRPFLLGLVKTASLQDTHYVQRIRHIFKMAEYRQDAEIFGILAYRFDKEPQGYYHSYSYATRRYFRKRVWRTLRKLGQEGDAMYVQFASKILLQYSDSDAQNPKQTTFSRWDYSTQQSIRYENRWDAFAVYLIFNPILYTNSPRYHFPNGTRAWRCRENYKPGDAEPQQREEAFPELWEQQPDVLLKLLRESRCRPVHHFAVKALRACRDFYREIELETLIQLLHQPYEVTVEFAFEIARERYDASSPNLALVEALVHCPVPAARSQAYEWIEAAKDFFLASTEFIVSPILSCEGETRQFARRLLSEAVLGEAVQQGIVGRVLAELLARSGEEYSGEAIRDAGETLHLCFASQLRTLRWGIIQDLLDSSRVEVQEMGARILLNHEIPVAELPMGLIDSLITSSHEEIRRIGVQLFGQLPEQRLLEEYDFLAAIATSNLSDLRESVRSLIERLATSHPDFATRMAREFIALLLLPERQEGLHSDIVVLLRENIPGWMSQIDRDTALQLLRAKSSAARELGGVALGNRVAEWTQEFSTREIVQLASHEIFAVREAARSMFLQILDRMRRDPQEFIAGARLLESTWTDSREFAIATFSAFGREDWTPEVMVSICDSVREEVRQFGRNLVINHFQSDWGQDYLLKFSEHPSADMQAFATNYLEDYAAGNCDRLQQLSPYCITVLSQVNRGRVSKDRIFAFLAAEAKGSEEAARIVADILTQQSLTIAIGDKAKAIQTLLQIKQQYPQIDNPLVLIRNS